MSVTNLNPNDQYCIYMSLQEENGNETFEWYLPDNNWRVDNTPASHKTGNFF